jgi:Uma2 family endonuclease
MMSIAAHQQHLDSFATPPGPVRRFTVEEYHSLIDRGVLLEGEPFELLEGWIVAKMTRKPPHDVAIALVDGAIRSQLQHDWHMRIQSAITTADSEPEPDLAVVRGQPRDYLDHHPGPADIALVVEVADASLDQDRRWKGRLYARAGVPAYWIVNLNDRCVEIYNDPTGPAAEPGYRQLETRTSGHDACLNIPGHAPFAIAVADLLP